jgi:uncharacterized protein YqjF (DUF2071 family)
LKATFLTATWRNLALVNYEAPPGLLEAHLPDGCELDLLDGRPMMSLVAFEFLDTRVLGVPWPGFRDFPEWNLRFYARRGSERGVCFVREIVPQAWVCAVARGLYGEPYSPAPMRVSRRTTRERADRRHEVLWKGRVHRIDVRARNAPFLPAAESEAAWFKEQQWGFRGRRRYRVEHRPWRVFPVDSCTVDVDWGLLYGAEWRVMQDATPQSVVLAEGSPVRVEWWSGG